MNTAQATDKLARARELTRTMREYERRIVEMNTERRALLRSIWRDEGMSQREIASELGVTGQTVWNEIHRKEHQPQH